jgi:hypothetical protein
MTITLPRWSAALLIALVGILGGLAIGQVTRADSASGPSATASYTAPFELTLKEMARDLHSVKGALGRPGIAGSILEELDKIRGNTYGTCQAAGGSPFCHSF